MNKVCQPLKKVQGFYTVDFKTDNHQPDQI